MGNSFNKMVAVKLSQELLDYLDMVAKETHSNRSEYLRSLLEVDYMNYNSTKGSICDIRTGLDGFLGLMSDITLEDIPDLNLEGLGDAP